MQNVPVIPNEAMVCGKVVQVYPDAVVITVCEVKDVPGFANFAKSYADGGILVVHGVTAKLNEEFAAKISFRGDEHGGKFFVVG